LIFIIVAVLLSTALLGTVDLWHVKSVLLSSRKVLVMEDEFASPCPWITSPCGVDQALSCTEDRSIEVLFQLCVIFLLLLMI